MRAITLLKTENKEKWINAFISLSLSLLLARSPGAVRERSPHSSSCSYSSSSNRSAMASCLLPQGCRDFAFYANVLISPDALRVTCVTIARAEHRLPRRPGAHFSKAPETFLARKAIFPSSMCKNGEEYTPETSCMK